MTLIDITSMVILKDVDWFGGAVFVLIVIFLFPLSAVYIRERNKIETEILQSFLKLEGFVYGKNDKTVRCSRLV